MLLSVVSFSDTFNADYCQLCRSLGGEATRCSPAPLSFTQARRHLHAITAKTATSIKCPHSSSHFLLPSPSFFLSCCNCPPKHFFHWFLLHSMHLFLIMHFIFLITIPTYIPAIIPLSPILLSWCNAKHSKGLVVRGNSFQCQLAEWTTTRNPLVAVRGLWFV